MPKHINANDVMHIDSQIKAENIYIAPIYMYTRLRLGVYRLYIYVQSNTKACAQSTADINIYISLNLAAQG